MRKDALGLFWRDEPVIKIKKEKPKLTPPEPIWLKDDYLPGLEEAEVLAGVEVMSDADLIALSLHPVKQELVFDIEIYHNYFLAGFAHLESKKVTWIEFEYDDEKDFLISKLDWILKTFTTVGFNSNNFDLPITAMAIAGRSTLQMKEAANRIIVVGERPADVIRAYGAPPLIVDHIDLIEVAPLRASLKIYGGRLHSARMQDLPFPPEKQLSLDQRLITRYYCLANDLMSTIALRNSLSEQLALRTEMSNKYGIDLRSKSDAQISEHVITAEVRKLTGRRVQRPVIPPGTVYHYKPPHYLQFKSPLMQHVLEVIRTAKFIVADHGSIDMPPEVSALKLQINQSTYQMGIGGLHSTESKLSHVEDSEYELFDFDVTSYYPKIILNQNLFPAHMGAVFLQVYNGIVVDRINAKRAGRNADANSLKIVVNGSFGKLGSKYSNFYSPDLLVQVTLSGQLSLLLLIETLEMAGIQVVSANTDGIVVKPRKSQIDAMRVIIEQWQRNTRFEMEESRYLGLYSRDVNNYIAVKKKFNKETKQWEMRSDGVKSKGAYSNPWRDDKDKASWLSKNPVNTICIEAVENLLTTGKPIVATIHESRDIRKFISVRTVTGGAYKDGIFLGKSIRWYYAKEMEGHIVYATKGSKVPRSDGAKPVMDLPTEFPDDIDYDWYINEAEKILKEIGYF